MEGLRERGRGKRWEAEGEREGQREAVGTERKKP